MLSLSPGTSSLTEAEHREAQRRAESNIEHTASLPAFIVHWITKFDVAEREREESNHAAHVRLVDAIQRFFTKLQAENTKYQAKMEELEVTFFYFLYC